MSKHKTKPPAADRKVYVMMAMILLGLLVILVMNHKFGQEAARIGACMTVQRTILAAVTQAQEADPGALDKLSGDDVAKHLIGKGFLRALPSHPGSPKDAASPFKFGSSGIFYCETHGGLQAAQDREP